MKFKHGDEIDQNLCLMIRHEFLRCKEAFQDFIAAGQRLQQGDETREVSYRAYNAYARFILHLYEFLLACDQRTRGDTSELKGGTADGVIAASAQIAFRNATAGFNAAALGAAPYNSGITESIEGLKDFATALRRARNTAMGHVKHERAELNLSDFYRKYHKYLLALYRGSVRMWGDIGEEFPQLGEVTAFSVLVRDTPPGAVS
ncbi:hypothetical protein [Paraburkholderia dipogonis]|uniref:hypothetical protein n=1 Tax=Paraburkholderia dipogonis TaxID=1211383 RepID=UPI0038BDFD55